MDIIILVLVVAWFVFNNYDTWITKWNKQQQKKKSVLPPQHR